MIDIILLDTGPLGALAHPSEKGDIGRIKQWYASLRMARRVVRVPQISDYELRRELIREGLGTSIALLNKLIGETGGLVPIDAKTMNKAAQLWAKCRNDGTAPCDDTALDGDVILCAQAWALAGTRREVSIATGNKKHIESMATCALWHEIEASKQA